MRIRTICGCWLLLLLLAERSAAQDFSNKGKDFWVGYGYHVRMITGNGGTQQMVLYFATESVTTVTVSIPGLGYSVTYPDIPANTIFTSNPVPKTGPQDARLTAEGISNAGIHISSTQPIVAYAHIYDGNVSGATLLFPTNTLGREYYSVNYNQVSNENRSNSWFYAVAVDTGTTVVQITPSANTLTRPAGQPFTVTLQQGQIINVMGELISTGVDPFTGTDLTGSTIRSISSGTGGCKRIAVFSGSGKLSITCNNTSSSADNYFVQAFPKTAWGKRYLTTPTQNFANNIYRVCVTDPATVVRLDGQILTGLQNDFFYEFITSLPSLIESDKPILTAQYISSQSACGNGVTDGDPEVIYLSPVEQNIDRVILNSTQNFAITQHFINVVIKSGGISSFRLDGNPVTGFIPHPQDASYAYAQLSVNAGSHTLQSDSGFNATAYGYGQFESYGYNAGTNVKDLYQFVSVQNQYATVNFPAACKSSPFFLSMTFPYQPTQLKWVFGQDLNALGMTDLTINSPQFDSTWTVDDKRLYRYRLATPYVLPVTGTFPIRVIAQNPTEEGCSGEQEIDYELQVFERPSAGFAFTSSGCLSDSVLFTDQSSLDGRQSIRWVWDFGDNSASEALNPSHLYSRAGAFPVRYSVVSDIGCLSDTAVKTVTLSNLPVAGFTVSGPTCVGKTVRFTNTSVSVDGVIAKWIWNFGDNSAAVTATTGAAQQHQFTAAGTYTVTLEVETAGGCKSAVFSRQVTITNAPKADFDFGIACLPTGDIQFTNRSTAGGTSETLSFSWDFGDGGRSTEKDPPHRYTTAGPFTVRLEVVSSSGCTDTISKLVTTIYETPIAGFSAPAEICLGTNLTFNDQSQAPNSSVTGWEWNFGDGSAVSTLQHPGHLYSAPGTYTVRLKITSAAGCVSAEYARAVVVNPLPEANFAVVAPFCADTSIRFTNTSVAHSGSLSKFTWDFGDGTAPVNEASPLHRYKLAGSYTVSLGVETTTGCKSNLTTRQIAVHPLPEVSFIVPGNCINDPVSSFIDTSSISDGSQGQFQWLWNFGDPNASPAQNVSSVQNGQHKYTATGNYTVSLTVTSKDGCTAALAKPFTINGAVPVPQVQFPAGLEICSSDTVAFTDNSTVDPGKLVKLEIYWDYLNRPTDKQVIDYPVKGTTYRHHYSEFFTPATKTFRLKLVLYSGLSCLTEIDTTITVKASPEILLGEVAPVCINRSSFMLQGAAANTSGTGVFAGTGVTAAGAFNPATAGVGTHIIQYSFTASNGCRKSQQQSVTVLPAPTVSAGPDKTVLEGGAATLSATATGTGLTYTWTPPTFLSSTSVLQPVAKPTDDIRYTLTVQTADGCSASDEVLVKVLKSPSIPNAFSPNGDGVHDRWEIQYLDSYPGATVEVFNRYGQKVFESRGYAKPWDGTANGKGLPVGTYYYIIDPKNGRKPLAGHVDLLR